MKTYYNANLVLPEGIAFGSLTVEQGVITRVCPGGAAPETGGIDLQENYLAPGFIDTHIHGGGGCDFNDGTPQAFVTAALTHLRHGITTLCPTLVAADVFEIERAFAAFRQAQAQLDGQINLLGLHLEGPYLCMEQKGAIDAAFIRAPKAQEYLPLIEKANGAIVRWTFAPELADAQAFLRALLQAGILPSIGHSNAEYETVREAFAAGCPLITHLYCAMSTIVRRGGFRYPGVIESAFCIDGIQSEIIADGCHLPAQMLRMLWRVLGAERLLLTCDAIRCAGTNVRESVIGSNENGQRIIIEDAVAKLPDRTAFAGSIATADRLIRTMYHDAGVPLHDSVTMYTLTPARLLGIDGETGSLAPGKRAELVCFNEAVQIKGVLAPQYRSGIF